MPANLTLQYYKAEEQFKAATSDTEKLDALKEMLATIPKHKGTEKLQAELKSKIAKFRRLLTQSPKKTAASRGAEHIIQHQGAGQILVIGAPNSGKTSLVSKLSGRELEIADYPYTTITEEATMVNYINTSYQLVDTPPLDDKFDQNWYFELIKNCDRLAIAIDPTTDPVVQWNLIYQRLTEHLIYPVKSRSEINNPRRHKKSVILLTKHDLDPELSAIVRQMLDGETELELVDCSVNSTRDCFNINRQLFDLLDVIRVYSKTPGKQPDKSTPFILKRGDRLEDFATLIHKEIAASMKTARCWGEGRQSGNLISPQEILQDEDVIEIKT